MDVEIVSKKENALLERTDVVFRVEHPNEKTPQRGAVRDKLAAALGAKSEAVIVTRMRSRYGRPVTEGVAKAYKSVEGAKNTEVPFLLKRHGLIEKTEASAKAAEAPPPPPPPPKPAAEKKPETKPAAEKPAPDKKPAGEKKPEAKPAADKPTAEKKPAAEKKPEAKPAAEKHPAEKKPEAKKE